MQIVLTNDDGVYAPGLRALRKPLGALGQVTVIAPATEQSGVGHAITTQNPLIVHEVFEGEESIGWQVEGSPADCVKLACMELCKHPPDLIVSGMNYGSNAGINVLYSGTVAAAIEGAFFGICAVAVSMEYHEHANFARGAELAIPVIRQILDHGVDPGALFNVNIPDLSIREPKGIRVVPQGIEPYKSSFQRRVDPRGRTYFWPGVDYVPGVQEGRNDVAAMRDGFITVTPLRFDLTHHTKLEAMNDWEWRL